MPIDTTGFDEITDTIRDFAEPLTVIRPTDQTTDYGFTNQRGAAVTGVTGHMQPLSDKELRFMPEGLNTQETWNIWSLAEILEGDQVNDDSGSPIVTVIRLKFWKEGAFWHTQGVLVDDATALVLPSIFSDDFSDAFQ